jgi:hypothetical protein
LLYASRHRQDAPAAGNGAAARAVGAWLSFAVALGLIPLLGFGLSFGLLSAFLILVFDRRSLRQALAVAVGLAVAFHLLFTVALGVTLPVGLLGF